MNRCDCFFFFPLSISWSQLCQTERLGTAQVGHTHTHTRTRARCRCGAWLKSMKFWESSRRREGGGRRGEGGGGILQAGAAVPARLTPSRLCGARLGLLEERRLRGTSDLRQGGRTLPRPERERARRYLHNKSGNSIVCYKGSQMCFYSLYSPTINWDR